MIDTVIVEMPNPGHPYGVRGVGETSIVPPLAAVANAVSAAAGVRLLELPMSPPRVLKAIGEQKAEGQATATLMVAGHPLGLAQDPRRAARPESRSRRPTSSQLLTRLGEALSRS